MQLITQLFNILKNIFVPAHITTTIRAICQKICHIQGSRVAMTVLQIMTMHERNGPISSCTCGQPCIIVMRRGITCSYSYVDIMRGAKCSLKANSVTMFPRTCKIRVDSFWLWSTKKVFRDIGKLLCFCLHACTSAFGGQLPNSGVERSKRWLPLSEESPLSCFCVTCLQT